MAIAERLATRTVAPEIGADVVRHAETFARIARGVRLTLILETKLDGKILAYRKGDAAAFDEIEAAASTRTAREFGRPTRTAADAERRREYDNDVEEGEYDRLPTGGFKAWVAEICDELGLDPDWSCWSDEEGFIHDDGRPVTEWPIKLDASSSPAADSAAPFHRLE